MKKILYVPLALVLIVGFVLAGCSSQPSTTSSTTPAVTTSPTTSTAPATTTTKSPSPTPTPRKGGTLTILYSRDHTVVGYPAGMSGNGQFLAYPVLESLLNFDENGQFLPTNLATGFTVGSDGKSVTMTLRKGVKFHDGTDFNAAAAKWNLEQIKAAKASGTESWTSI